MEKRPVVTCPLCQRKVNVDPLHGTDSQGKAAMQWHLEPSYRECRGSYLSVEAAAKLKGAK